MKRAPANLLPQPVHLRRLQVSTNIRLHPGFYQKPASFARRNGVDLAGDVNPETSFKEDPDTGEKDSKVKANIHLVRHGAIRIFTVRDDFDDRIRSIDLSPSLLLHGDEDHPLAEGDLAVVQATLRTKVAPLLADPLDKLHIAPGLGDDLSDMAYWSAVKSEVLLPGVDMRCLHDMSHPSTGPAAGVSKKRVELRSRGGSLVIRLEKAAWKVAGPDGGQSVRGVRVTLRLAGQALLARYGPTCTTALLNETSRLIAFRLGDVTRVSGETLLQLEGTCLPVPPEWAGTGKSVTHAKAMALLSVLTPVPLGELRAMDEHLRRPSESTRKRLDKDVPAAVACLKPVPVSTIFLP